MRRRSKRGLKRRYGRALPVVLIPLAKAGGVAFTKLKSLGLAERALEPVVELGEGAWGLVTGKKHKKGRKAKR
jgi:hypothetical protein